MKKIFIVVTFIIFSIKLFGQLWCTPNSEWYNSQNGFGSNGYIKINYTNTVSINTITCQKLNLLFVSYNAISNYTTSSNQTYYTYVNDSIVYLRSTSTVFDTLYNFKAKIGDSWLIPRNSFTTCPRYKVTVTDTGHKLIQNINLKWLKISSINQSETIYERIGSLSIYSFFYTSNCGFVDSQVGGSLRCFNDYQITNFKKYSQNCD